MRPSSAQRFVGLLTFPNIADKGSLFHTEPRSNRDKVIAHSAMSVGYGREVGVIMLIYIMAFAYAACSPIILPFTLCYFTSAWVRTGLTRRGISGKSCVRSALTLKMSASFSSRVGPEIMEQLPP